MSHCIEAYIAKHTDFEKAGIKAMPLPQGFAICTSAVEGQFPCVYVQTNYFGGFGTQGAKAWDKDGKEIYNLFQDEEGEAFGTHPINEALKLLGVERTSEMDEFDSINLGHCRENEDFNLENADWWDE